MTARPPGDPRQSPVHLRKELLTRGHDDRSIARAVRDKKLHRIRRGAYVDEAAWQQLDESGRYGLRARAVLKQANTPLVLSHLSALPEYDAPLWSLDLDPVHVTRPDGRAGRREAGVQQHRGRLLEGDVTELHGVPLTSPSRTAIDITTVAGTEAALVVVNHLLHQGLTTPEKLVARYEQGMDHWPHTLTTNLVLRLMDGLCESPGESRTLFLCWHEHLPAPVPQYQVRDGTGDIIARLDFAWPKHKVYLEFDGKTKYTKLLKEGESITDVVLREKRREELVCRLTGWRCIRITWADLARPEVTAALIRNLLFPGAAAN